MSAAPFDENAYLDQLLALHDLQIEASWRVGIVANLVALRRAGELVMSMELDESIEPAPVYQASGE